MTYLMTSVMNHAAVRRRCLGVVALPAFTLVTGALAFGCARAVDLGDAGATGTGAGGSGGAGGAGGGGAVDCSSTVPNGASVAGVTLSNFSINGGSNVAVVTPGATVTIRFDYNITDCGFSSCIDQIQIGFLPGTPIYCAYNGVPGCSGASGSSTRRIMVPFAAGVYDFHFDRSQAFRCPLARYWGATGPDVIVGRICVGP